MKAALISKEYPPEIYGGAGVHVAELSKALRKLIEVEVFCFGKPRSESGVHAFDVPSNWKSANPALQTLAVDLEIVQAVAESSHAKSAELDIIHSHTWYANYAGFLSGKLLNKPHVLSAHSLEPLRPWKAEQLGLGYEISSQVEKMAYAQADGIIAVSHAMRADILKVYADDVDPDKVSVIHNGINVEDFQSAVDPAQTSQNRQIAEQLGVNPELPSAIFVGRITRQKGIELLLDSISQINQPIQWILAASSPDTPEIARNVAEKISALKSSGKNIIWLDQHLSRRELLAVLSVSQVFLCPSIYEPLGIVNLEAMACRLPVVASKVGGIPEVVLDSQTGFLVDYDATQTEKFVSDFAGAVKRIFDQPQLAQTFGKAGWLRARDNFSWDLIAQRTIDFYSKFLL
jgi:starch synthase